MWLGKDFTVLYIGYGMHMCYVCVTGVATYLDNLEKSGNLTVVREKSGKSLFACGVPPQLR